MIRYTLPMASLCALLTLAPAGAADAADLVVRVTGLRAPEGVVRLALYDTPEEFPRGRRLVGGEVTAEGATVEYVFEGLKPGTYAVAIYHDQDGDGEFDQGIFGLPLEGYGFSNGARAGLMGAPDFDEAAVTVDGAETVDEIEMRY